MKTEYKHIHFTNEADEYWYCWNNKSDELLGEIIFYKKWKQWIYRPMNDVIYSYDCLEDIADFLKQLNEEIVK